jgi:DNA-directed RNA polymerase beta subunit
MKEIEMYNDFLQTGIANCLKAHNPLCFKKNDVECNIYMGDKDGTNIDLVEPDNRDNDDYDERTCHYDMYPNDARRNKKTYALTVICGVEVEMTFLNKEKKQETFTLKFHSIILGTLPLMVNSIKCITNEFPRDNIDKGGYFIIKGEEQILPVEILQRVFEDTYQQNIQCILPRIAKYHKQQSKYSGEKLPKLFSDNFDYIFKFKNTMRRRFHILFANHNEL